MKCCSIFFSIRSLLHFDDFLVSNQAVVWDFLICTTTISIAILAVIFFSNTMMAKQHESTILSKLGHIRNVISYA